MLESTVNTLCRESLHCVKSAYWCRAHPAEQQSWETGAPVEQYNVDFITMASCRAGAGELLHQQRPFGSSYQTDRRMTDECMSGLMA